jgi:membrane protease YdiL (CAAX protease family)
MVQVCVWWEPEGVLSPSDGTPAPKGDQPTWGLGDAAAGVVAAQVLSVLVIGVVYAATGWSAPEDIPIWATGLLQIPLWIGLAGAVWYAAQRKGHGLSADFGFSSRVMDAPVGLVVGIACQVLVLPLLYWPVLRALGVSSDELSEPAERLAGRAEGTTGWLVLAAMVVVAAPLVEELFYRGLLLRAMTKRGWSPWVAVLGSAALFAAMHFQPLQFIGLFAFGLVLGALAQLYGRLGPAIWAHVGFNGTTVVALYLGTH